MDKFELKYQHVLRDIEGLNVTNTAMQFHFKNVNTDGTDPHTLFFANRDRIYELNYVTAAAKDVGVFD